jgi:hypothetical protein
MFGRFAASLAPVVFCVALSAQHVDPERVVTMSGDAVRSAEIQRRMLLARFDQQARDVQVLKEAQRRQFQVQFNQLVDAVASFAKRYNEGQGTTWPKHEADQLRKAMSKVQSLEKSLRPERPAKAR